MSMILYFFYCHREILHHDPKNKLCDILLLEFLIGLFKYVHHLNDLYHITFTIEHTFSNLEISKLLKLMNVNSTLVPEHLYTSV